MAEPFDMHIPASSFGIQRKVSLTRFSVGLSGRPVGGGGMGIRFSDNRACQYDAGPLAHRLHMNWCMFLPLEPVP